MENSIQITIAVATGYILHGIVRLISKKKEIKLINKDHESLINHYHKSMIVHKDDLLEFLVGTGLCFATMLSLKNEKIIEYFENARKDKKFVEFSEMLKKDYEY